MSKFTKLTTKQIAMMNRKAITVARKESGLRSRGLTFKVSKPIRRNDFRHQDITIKVKVTRIECGAFMGDATVAVKFTREEGFERIYQVDAEVLS